jgi:hypothetical protein
MPLLQKVGKLRGDGFRAPRRRPTAEINLSRLNRFEAGSRVGPEEFLQAGLIANPTHRVKILGAGDLDLKLTVVAHAFSKSARSAIEKAGGSVEFAEGEPVSKRRSPGAATAPAERAAEPVAQAPTAGEEAPPGVTTVAEPPAAEQESGETPAPEAG